MAEAIPQTTTAATEPSVRAPLAAAVAISAFTLAVATFELAMADWPSGVVLLAVVPLMALVFCGCALWSATLLLKIRSGGTKFALPFLVCALTLAILVYAPLQQIALEQNFRRHRQDRERIVARVEAGELKPNVSTNKSLIALGDRAPHVSAGGNDIVVDETDDGTYVLTGKGKEFANRFDTDARTVERQPKVAVCRMIRRGDKQLVQQRLKQPYYGYWGRPTGKIRWGETIIAAAEREAVEETGLTADFRIAGVYHEHVVQAESEQLLEDKVFFVAEGTNVSGQLMTEFEGGRNQWMTFDEAFAKDKKFDSFKMEIEILASRQWLIERSTTYKSMEF